MEPSVTFKGVVGGSSKAAVNTPVKSEVSVEPSHATVASEELISEFITQLACLIK